VAGYANAQENLQVLQVYVIVDQEQLFEEVTIMFWSRKQPLVGIDIGTHTIKLVQLKRVGGGYQLLNFGVMPLVAGAIVDGAIRQPDLVVEAIRNLVRAEEIRTTDVVTAVSGQSVIVKKIRMPKQMSRREIAENLQWEAEQHIPFEISDVNIDFQELPNVEGTRRSGIFSGFFGASSGDNSVDEQTDVLLVAARKSKVEDYTGLLLEAGLHPVVVDTDVFAIENSYEVNYDGSDDVVALVDIGASTMNVNILKGNVTLFQRDIPIGGNRYTAAIEQEFRVRYEQAEGLKMGVGFTPEITREQVLMVMMGVSDAIGEEIQRSLEFFHSSIAEDDIDRMIMSGGCARIKGLDQFLSHRLEVPVEIADPFRNLRCSEKQFDPDYLRDMAPVAAVGVGLALREMDDQ
jgi:type IV pilus assembly protein PilM